MFPFDSLENIRKPSVFSCFQGDQKETLGRNRLRYRKWMWSNLQFILQPICYCEPLLIKRLLDLFSWPINELFWRKPKRTSKYYVIADPQYLVVSQNCNEFFPDKGPSRHLLRTRCEICSKLSITLNIFHTLF